MELLARHGFWALLLGAFLFWTFGQLDGMASQRDREITASSRAALVSHGALVRYRATLEAAETRALMSMRVASRRSDSLRVLLASGQRTDTLEVFHEIAVADSQALAACRVGVLACQQRAASAEAEADSLTARLTAQLSVGRCRVLVVPCPPRMVYLLTGALGGYLLAR